MRFLLSCVSIEGFTHQSMATYFLPKDLIIDPIMGLLQMAGMCPFLDLSPLIFPFRFGYGQWYCILPEQISSECPSTSSSLTRSSGGRAEQGRPQNSETRELKVKPFSLYS